MNPQNPQQNPNRQVQQELLKTSFGGVSQLGTTTPTTQQLGQQNHPQQLQGSAQQVPSQSLPQQQPFASQQSQVPQQGQQSLQQIPLQVEQSPQLTRAFPQQGVQATQQVPQYSQQAKQIPQQVPQYSQQTQQFPQQSQQLPLQSQQVPQGTQQLPQQIQQYPQQAQQVPQQTIPGAQLPQQQVPQFQQQGQQIPQQAQQPIGEATSSWQTVPLTQETLSGATSPYSTQEMSGQQAQTTTQPRQAQTMGQPQQTHAGAQAQQAVGQTVGFGGMTGTQAGFSQTVPGQTGGTEIPAVDMFEGDDKFVLLANLAGYKSDEIDLEASGETVRIVAARQDTPEEDLRPLQRERLNRAERVVQLPSIVDVDDAEATCKNGVCRITLPKAAEASNRRIGVQ